MNSYRSNQTIEAVQYTGEFIPDVMCTGVDADRNANGCDGTRAHLPHVHTRATGGLTVVKPGDWIIPERGGPFLVFADEKFRGFYEVPAVQPLAETVIESPQDEERPPVVEDEAPPTPPTSPTVVAPGPVLVPAEK